MHIAPEGRSKRIKRNGIGARRWDFGDRGMVGHDCVVWAFPILESYTLTHSWSRELKRWGTRTLVGVTFQIEDEAAVYVRHYARRPRLTTAADAVRVIRAIDDPRGYEIMVPRRILSREIKSVRVLPRAIGWRYWPAAKGMPAQTCDCPVCLPSGEVKARRYRERVKERRTKLGLEDW